MFVFDWIGSAIYDGLVNWVKDIVIEIAANIFDLLNVVTMDIFSNEWIHAFLYELLQPLAYTLFAVGLGVAAFEVAIAYKKGQGDLMDIFINGIKGFLASGLIIDLPIAFFWMCTNLGNLMTKGVAGENFNISSLGESVMDSMTETNTVSGIEIGTVTLIVLAIIFLVAIVKTTMQIFKRGGIMVIYMVLGVMYMFSVPRGFTDGFTGWCKQMIGLGLQIFLLSFFQIIGLWSMAYSSWMVGLGLILSATEIPRVFQSWGTETGVRGNMMGATYAASSVFRMVSSIKK